MRKPLAAALLQAAPWISEYTVRLREEGHILSGEAIVVPVSDVGLAANVEQTMTNLRELDWRLRDVVIAPVTGLRVDDEPPDASVSPG